MKGGDRKKGKEHYTLINLLIYGGLHEESFIVCVFFVAGIWGGIC